MNNEDNGWDYTVNVDASHTRVVMTKDGPQAVPSIIKLGHELFHAILGVKDDGPGNMNTVNKYENPLRRELGYPMRTQY
jgi:hypothetical protein